ncbi:hypothetical protein JY465_04350 [Stenotrophomonas maltophilia]|nr:hypothetical protein [Stenotrophomonas maltophilia]
MEYIARKGFNDPSAEGGYQKRGQPWTGPDTRAKELQLLGLIGPAEAEGKAAPPSSNKMAPAAANKGAPAAPEPGAALVRQKAADAIIAIAAVTDLALLDAALKAETAKGDKARATVIKAIETAIKAATPAQA